MLIGHAPAGYLLSRWLSSRLRLGGPRRRAVLLTGILCSVLPDLDLLYFYTVDARQHHHHTYWSHTPVFWGCAFAGLLPVALRYPLLRPFTAVAGSCVFLHLVLDSISAKILWLYPLSDRSFGLFEVPSVHSAWVLNFLTHWTFALELGLLLAAVICAMAVSAEGGGGGERRAAADPSMRRSNRA